MDPGDGGRRSLPYGPSAGAVAGAAEAEPRRIAEQGEQKTWDPPAWPRMVQPWYGAGGGDKGKGMATEQPEKGPGKDNAGGDHARIEDKGKESKAKPAEDLLSKGDSAVEASSRRSHEIKEVKREDCEDKPAASRTADKEKEWRHYSKEADGVKEKERPKREREVKEEGAGTDMDEPEQDKKGLEDVRMELDVKVEDKVKMEAEDVLMDDVQGERERDALVVQQRKRQLRQVPPRETRSRLKSKFREGLHGRPESSFVSYKPGEGLPDLLRLWKEFQSNPDGVFGPGPTLEVRIPAELATTSNKQVRGSQLWGTDIYTDDSDLVAVLMHTGYYSPTPSPPPACILELRATIRILPPQNSYKSTLRNVVRSRAWGAASGCSYSIERCRIVKNGGKIIDLEPSLNRTPVVAPTLAPAALERTMTTRAASSNAHRQQRFVQEVTIQYNLCNEPWLKYTMSIVADRGLKKSQYTSARLKKGDVLYLETQTHRYELSYDGEKAAAAAAAAACNGSVPTTTATSQGPVKDKEKQQHQSHQQQQQQQHQHQHQQHHGNGGSNGQSGESLEHFYKWSRCKFPFTQSTMHAKGIPLPADCIQVIEDGLMWGEVQWSPTGVWIRGQEFPLVRAQFLCPVAK